MSKDEAQRKATNAALTKALQDREFALKHGYDRAYQKANKEIVRIRRDWFSR